MTHSRRNEPELGYGKPPISNRFKKGQSGNPKGRPKNRKRGLPYDHILGQMVTIREGGRERRVTAGEAFLLHLTKKGLEGDGAAARAALAAIEDARSKRPEKQTQARTIVCKSVSPGSVGQAIDALGMAVKLNPYSEDARYALKPWIVQIAVNRLKSGQLTLAAQQTVVAATRTPEKVIWPDWWEARF